MGRILEVAQGDITGVRRSKNKKAYYADTKDGRAPQLRSVTAALGHINKAEVLIPWALGLQAECARELAPLGKVLTPELLEVWINEFQREFENRRWKAADIGTHVHKLIQSWLRCDPDGPTAESIQQEPPEVQNCMRLFWDWWKGKGLKVVEVEQVVWNGPHGYAGTLDFVCELPSGKLALIDWKSSKGIYPEMYLQLAAYYYALLAMGCTEDDFEEITIVRIGKTDLHFEAAEIPREILPEAYRVFYMCLRSMDGLAKIESLDKKRWAAHKRHTEALTAQKVEAPF